MTLTYNTLKQFEGVISEYTGAPYVVLTDSCTHAIEMVFRACPPTEKIQFACNTYLSIPMLMHKINLDYELIEEKWNQEYHFYGTNVWDSARRFDKNMFRPGNVQCCSFGRTKPLAIGQGGCVLTDDAELAQAVYEMRYDGRQLYEYDRWPDQQTFRVGFHYYMRPEEAVAGLNLLANEQFTFQKQEFYNYPDCRNIQIV